MRKLIILLFISLFVLPVYSQNWNPFPFNQETYFKTDISIYYSRGGKDSYYIMKFKFDSVYNKEDGTAIYYDWRYRQFQDLLCADSLSKNISDMDYYHGNIFWDKHDVFAIKNDTMYYFYDYYYTSFKHTDTGWVYSTIHQPLTFYLPLNVENEQSWEMDIPEIGDTASSHNKHFVFSTTLASEEFIFPNIKDSVRTINMFYNDKIVGKFVMSKNYGFLEFPPLYSIFKISGDELKTSQLKQLELTGLEKDGKQYGMIPIKYTFDEFFQLDVGDIKYWEIYPKLIADSIIAVERTDEYLQYIYSCYEYYVGDNSYSTYLDSEKVYYADFEQILSNNLNTIVWGDFNQEHAAYRDRSKKRLFLFKGNVLVPTDSIHKNHKHLIEGIEYSYWMYNESVELVDKDKCIISGHTDFSTWRSYYPVIGNDNKYFWLFDDFLYGSVVAFKKDGVVYGTIPEQLINVSVKEDIAKSTILFPNPTDGNFTVEFALDAPSNVEFQLYNSLGEKIFNSENELFLDGLNKKEIDASNLSNGIYFCKMITQTNTKYLKFIVIR